MVCIVNFVLVHVKVAHNLPVESLEGHGVGVITQAEFVFGFHDLLQVLHILIMSVFFKLLLLEDSLGRPAL